MKRKPQYMSELARAMRKKPTKEEAITWEAIRNQKLGVKFRRQHILGRYIADFYCNEKRLVIETDGIIHDTPDVKEYDRIRQLEIESCGLTVLQIRNEAIQNDLENVIEQIKEAIG